jgi:hypothetical protein
MNTYMLGKREVIELQIALDEDDGAYVLAGVFVDNGADLDDSQCDQLTDLYQNELYQRASEKASCSALDKLAGHS